MSFAGQVREAARSLGRDGATFSYEDIGGVVGIQKYAEKHKIWDAVADLRKAGEIELVSRGVLSWKGKIKQKPQIRERMWRALKAKGSVTVPDLQELAGASEAYAREWIQMLVRREVVRAFDNGRYQLIKDPDEMPQNTEAVEKYRNIRGRKKLALEAIRMAERALGEAKRAVADIDHAG